MNYWKKLYLLIIIIDKMSDNHLSMDLDDNSWIYNISKNLNEYINRPTKQSDIYNYRLSNTEI